MAGKSNETFSWSLTVASAAATLGFMALGVTGWFWFTHRQARLDETLWDIRMYVWLLAGFLSLSVAAWMLFFSSERVRWMSTLQKCVILALLCHLILAIVMSQTEMSKAIAIPPPPAEPKINLKLSKEAEMGMAIRKEVAKLPTEDPSANQVKQAEKPPEEKAAVKPAEVTGPLAKALVDPWTSNAPDPQKHLKAEEAAKIPPKLQAVDPKLQNMEAPKPVRQQEAEAAVKERAEQQRKQLELAARQVDPRKVEVKAESTNPVAEAVRNAPAPENRPQQTEQHVAIRPQINQQGPQYEAPKVSNPSVVQSENQPGNAQAAGQQKLAQTNVQGAAREVSSRVDRSQATGQSMSQAAGVQKHTLDTTGSAALPNQAAMTGQVATSIAPGAGGPIKRGEAQAVQSGSDAANVKLAQTGGGSTAREVRAPGNPSRATGQSIAAAGGMQVYIGPVTEGVKAQVQATGQPETSGPAGAIGAAGAAGAVSAAESGANIAQPRAGARLGTASVQAQTPGDINMASSPASVGLSSLTNAFAAKVPGGAPAVVVPTAAGGRDVLVGGQVEASVAVGGTGHTPITGREVPVSDSQVQSAPSGNRFAGENLGGSGTRQVNVQTGPAGGGQGASLAQEAGVARPGAAAGAAVAGQVAGGGAVGQGGAVLQQQVNVNVGGGQAGSPIAAGSEKAPTAGEPGAGGGARLGQAGSPTGSARGTALSAGPAQGGAGGSFATVASPGSSAGAAVAGPAVAPGTGGGAAGRPQVSGPSVEGGQGQPSSQSEPGLRLSGAQGGAMLGKRQTDEGGGTASLGSANYAGPASGGAQQSLVGAAAGGGTAPVGAASATGADRGTGSVTVAAGTLNVSQPTLPGSPQGVPGGVGAGGGAKESRPGEVSGQVSQARLAGAGAEARQGPATYDVSMSGPAKAGTTASLASLAGTGSSQGRISQASSEVVGPRRELADVTPLLKDIGGPWLSQRTPEKRQKLVEKMGGTKGTEKAVDRALAFLARAQELDGRWTFFTGSPNPGKHAKYNRDTGLTGLATLCFLAAGHTPTQPGPYQDCANKALAYLLTRQKPDGDLRGEGHMYDHAMATLALAEAAIMTGDGKYVAAAKKGAQFIIEAQDPDSGGWRYNPKQFGDTSVLGWQIMALFSVKHLGLKPPDAAFQGAARWLDRCSGKSPGSILSGYQDKNPTPAMSAEAAYTRILIGQRLTDAQAKEICDYLLAHAPGKENRSVWEKNDFYLWYYSSLLLMQLQNETWRIWNEKMQDYFLDIQREGGDVDGSWDPTDKHSWLGGRIYTTAIATLTLEVYYRYVPFYAKPTKEAP